MPGRKRKPTAVHIANGNPSKLKLNPEAEPDFTPGFGTMPTGLSAFGKGIWKTAVAELDRLNLLTMVDHGALSAAVCGADQGWTADRKIRGLQNKINRGRAEKADYYFLSIMNASSKKGWQQYKSFCTEFGLTPASRSRILVDVVAGPSPVGKAAGPVDAIEAALCDLPVQ